MKAEVIVAEAKAILEIMETQLLEVADMLEELIKTNPYRITEYKALRADIWVNLAEIYNKPEYDAKMNEYKGDLRD